jgi:hypothetical protein
LNFETCSGFYSPYGPLHRSPEAAFLLVQALFSYQITTLWAEPPSPTTCIFEDSLLGRHHGAARASEPAHFAIDPKCTIEDRMLWR